MKALVVYESSFGNTGKVARAVWEGLFSRLPDAVLLEVGAAPTHLPLDVQLVVVGGPTHAFEPPQQHVRAATFDTRIASPHVPGSAAAGARRALRRAGLDVTAGAESFWVLGTKGPLRDGELERAYSWGVGLTDLLLGGHRNDAEPDPAPSR